jgi:hypothetical protein
MCNESKPSFLAGEGYGEGEQIHKNIEINFFQLFTERNSSKD